MKLLIIAGAPHVNIEQLGITVAVDRSRTSIDVDDILRHEALADAEVTLLTTDVVSRDDVKVITAKSIDELTARAQYLALNVCYDVIVNLAMLPWWTCTGLKQFVNEDAPFDRTLEHVVDVLKQRPLLTFERQRGANPHAAMIAGLQDAGCKAGIINLVACAPYRESLRDVCTTATHMLRDRKTIINIVDEMPIDVGMRRAYFIGRSGFIIVEQSRTTEHIVRAILELAKTQHEVV